MNALIARVVDEKMLYLVGLGLGDAKDISVKGLEVVRNASKVYLEAYTSILTVGKEELVRDAGFVERGLNNRQIRLFPS